MRKKLFVLLTSVLFCGFFTVTSLNAFADGDIPGPLHPSRKGNNNGGNSNGGGPHAPIHFPAVYAYLDNMVLTVDATNLVDSVEVTIADEFGTPVITGTYSTATSFDINLTALPTGCYTLTIETETLIYEGEFEL